MTPEGRIKRDVKRLLARYEPHIWTYWPVPAGFGKQTLDCIGAIRGVPFAIETKAPGKDQTDRQQISTGEMVHGGVSVFTVDGPMTMEILEQWLKCIWEEFPVRS